MACELTSTCIFFNDQMQGKPAILALYKAQYCHADFGHCARYMVYLAMGRENVPKDLFNNDRLRAIQLLKAARVEVPGMHVPLAGARSNKKC